MQRMKSLFIYLILFIAFYLFVDGIIYLSTKDSYKDLTNYEILVPSPEIRITEYKVSYSKGHISGTATNNAGKLIDKIILKFDFYNENGSYMGTKYEEIKYFNVGETSKFTVNFGYKKIESVKISLVEEIPSNINLEELKENVQKWWPLAGLAALIYIL